MHRPHIRSIAILALIPSLGSAQARATVRPADYGKWETLGPGTLAPNGRWLAYIVNRVDEENELRIGGTARDSTVAVRYGSAPAFTGDSKWIAYAIGLPPAERDRAGDAAGTARFSPGRTDQRSLWKVQRGSGRFGGPGNFTRQSGLMAPGIVRAGAWFAALKYL